MTGGSDTNLSDAVHTLASGYGGGSGDNTTAVINNDTKVITYSNSDRWYSGKASNIFSLFPNLSVVYFDSIKDVDYGYFLKDFFYLKSSKSQKSFQYNSSSFQNFRCSNMRPVKLLRLSKTSYLHKTYKA